ncbi:hypothetical protein H696_05570 [Fonticula alba]|uniref:Secreted protein n=1 Tax=Fonticula alba TaxID=691883 RepID=A0A058Z0P2_FONAL|nr:hypothetical protein H696_05570 [Fonticula alba]KCV67839.1 hypothetical protein H696_05570 [Fonticula alba]|eukprot:XP_009497659.1 hypothetical protein H696_05570 [Fonticula alba]
MCIALGMHACVCVCLCGVLTGPSGAWGHHPRPSGAKSVANTLRRRGAPVRAGTHAAANGLSLAPPPPPGSQAPGGKHFARRTRGQTRTGGARPGGSRQTRVPPRRGISSARPASCGCLGAGWPAEACGGCLVADLPLPAPGPGGRTRRIRVRVCKQWPLGGAQIERAPRQRRMRGSGRVGGARGVAMMSARRGTHVCQCVRGHVRGGGSDVHANSRPPGMCISRSIRHRHPPPRVVRRALT